MKNSDIARSRIINQQLHDTRFKTVSELIKWFGAIQAQEYAHAKWALGMRLNNINESIIEIAFNKGELLRTHILRPTWHFVHNDDIRWMIALTAPRVKSVNAFMYRKMELTNNLLNKTTDILAKELEGGKYLTRTALNKVLAKKNIIADGIRLSCIMMQAELNSVICSGPRIGKQFTYALLDERVFSNSIISNEEALASLAKRYFLSRGPASIKDFSTWSGLTISDSKKGLEMIKSHVTKEVIEGEEYYFDPVLSITERAKKMCLLPIYDEYIMGYKNRVAILDIKNKYAPDTAFVFDNTIIYDGQIIGTWKRTIHKTSIDLEYSFFQPQPKEYLKLVTHAIKQYERFHDLPVNVMNG
jgi:hypothetical protein